MQPRSFAPRGSIATFLLGGHSQCSHDSISFFFIVGLAHNRKLIASCKCNSGTDLGGGGGFVGCEGTPFFAEFLLLLPALLTLSACVPILLGDRINCVQSRASISRCIMWVFLSKYTRTQLLYTEVTSKMGVVTKNVNPTSQNPGSAPGVLNPAKAFLDLG